MCVCHLYLPLPPSLSLSFSSAINAQVCAPGLPCDVNVLVTGIQGFLFEDDVKTCLQCAFDGVNSTTAVWSRPAGSIVAPFGSVSNGVLEICNTEEFISLGPSVVLTCTQTSSHQIIGNFRSELFFFRRYIPSITVLL